MKKKNLHRFFSAFMAMALVFTLLSPMNASANTSVKPFKQHGNNESIMQMKMAVAQQEQLLNALPSLHKDLQGLEGEQSVNVIILLSEDAVALAEGKKKINNLAFTASERSNALSKVKKQQTFVKKEMKAENLIVSEGYSYETVLNGFAATVKADDLKKLLTIKGVVLVEPDVERHALESSLTPDATVDAAMNTSISFLGIERIWDKGYKGKGIKVGVLDTGLDYHHPDFADIYKGGWNFVPHTGSDYARTRAENDPYETTPLDRPGHRPEFNTNGSSFYTSHGTHVAGTIAAIGQNEYGITGIAPEVDLHVYRVLGAYGSGANSGVIAGINKAVEEGMDIINLSLGGGTNSSMTSDTIAINNAMLAGTLAVMATGNSGPGRGTIGTPAAAALGLAVGNTTNPEARYDANVSVVAGAYAKTSNIKLMGTTFGTDLASQLNGEFDVVAVPGLGAPADYNGLDVVGKVALVSRGSIAFVDKIAAAKAAGAAAVLIHNFGAGTGAPGPSGTFLGDDFEFLPTFDMSQTEGDALRAALASNAGTVSFANFNTTFTAGDEVNSSSSRGPTTPSFDIKPDVSAPGTNIMSTIPMYGKDNPAANYAKAFTRKTGTSMATPHVAGIAALIMNANPNWNPFDVKVAISNTAKVLDTTKYDVFAQGPGRIQPYEAAFPKALAYAEDKTQSDGVEVDNFKGTVTFGHLDKVKDGAVTSTKQVRVKNLSGESSNYTVSVQVTKAFGNATVTVDKPTFTLNSEQLLNITLNAPKSAIKAGDELLGYIHISNGETNLSLPFAADFSPKAPIAPITNYKLTETDLSFNGDGIKDEGRLEFTLNTNVGTNYVELWDIMNPDGGYYGDGYIGYLHAGSSLAPGSYYLDIDGEYGPWGGTGFAQIPEGIYTVDFTALNLGAGPAVVEAWDGPLFVKSTPATIDAEEAHEAEDSTYEFTGQVVDKYIEWQEELALYGLGYNLNTKLATTFEAKDQGGTVVSGGPVNLAQDGSFKVEVSGLKNGDNTVTIFVNDAAGNKAEASFVVAYAAEVEEDVVEYAVNNNSLTLQVGDTESLTVTETTTKPDGTVTEKDVTADVTFASSDESIATVENGTVTAVSAGTTEITVTYNDFNHVVAVEVTEVEDVVEYAVNKNSLTLQVGDTESLTVTETTTKPDGTVTKEDVTGDATFLSADGTIAKVENGKVTAIKVGETEITVTYGGEIIAKVSVSVKNKDVYVPPYTPPTTPTPPANPGKVVIDEKDVSANAKDPKVLQIEVKVPALTEAQPQANVEFSIAALTAIAGSGKPLAVKAGEIEVIVPSDVFKAASQFGPGKVTLHIGLAGDAKFKLNGKVVSNVYEFSISVEQNGKTTIIPAFPKPIGVAIPVKATSFENSRKLAAYYVNEKTNTLEFLGGKYLDGKLRFQTNHFSKFVVVESNKTFKDIQSDEMKWAKDYIEVLASKNIIQGKSEDTFAPNDQITRAQFAVLLSRALNLPKQQYEGTFADVTEKTDWVVLEIEAASRAGIVTGINGNFRPNDQITRQQMAAMIIRAIEYQDATILEGVKSDVTFADAASIHDYAKEYVGLAAGLGIISGRDVNGVKEFAPTENATRAQAAKMLYYLLEKI